MKTIALLALIEILSPRFADYRPEGIGVEWKAGSEPRVVVSRPAEIMLVNYEMLEVEIGGEYEFFIPSLEGYFTGTVTNYIEWGLHWYWIEL